MDLELTEDQHELRRTAGDLLDARSPLRLARDYLDGRGDPAALWSILGDLGWSGVGLERDDPFGTPGLAVIAEQLGGHASPTLVVDSAVVARTLVTAGGTRSDELSDAIIAGRTASFAVLEASNTWSATAPWATTASALPGGFFLRGEKLDVHHGARADQLAVTVSGPDGPALALVARDAPGVALREEPGLDPARGAVRVSFDDVRVPSDAVLSAAACPGLLEGGFGIGALASAAEGLGAAGAALDLAVRYALDREQFGRPIGRFQAIQHLLADLHVQRETAWSAVLYAAASLDDGLRDAGESVSVAKAHAARATRTVVEGALQVFGGIGFTWEHDLHLLYRRALDCEQRFGDAPFHEQLLANVILRPLASAPTPTSI